MHTQTNSGKWYSGARENRKTRESERYVPGVSILGEGCCPRPTHRGFWPEQHHVYGSGTDNNPWVVWTVPGNVLDQILPDEEIRLKTIKETTRICKEEAIELGFKCIVVRGTIHSTSTVRNVRTGKIAGYEAADDRVTVYVGNSWAECQIHGHIYVKTDEDKVPIRKIRRSEDRKIIAQGCEAVGSEYWVARWMCERPSEGEHACPLKLRKPSIEDRNSDSGYSSRGYSREDSYLGSEQGRSEPRRQQPQGTHHMQRRPSNGRRDWKREHSRGRNESPWQQSTGRFGQPRQNSRARYEEMGKIDNHSHRQEYESRDTSRSRGYDERARTFKREERAEARDIPFFRNRRSEAEEEADTARLKKATDELIDRIYNMY
ncbi:hypothetical protein B0T17DRAFT_506074 [Bombardia bombarda]|uniref:Uncharacterized protein n=1 Tax=Bombardia bombarda TaxID=252184 RepID=A0AA39X9S8_9PEZI|nr:hypothetical protein B0T17DRAFT_506074 [Bombardia bombarda]